VTSVVLVEDESLIRAALRQLVDGEDDHEIVGEASNGVEALGVVAGQQPDVVVMDIRMPGLDGIEVTRRIQRYQKPPAVLLLTTFGAKTALLEGLRAGAAGFLLKSATPEQFLEAIRVVGAGDNIVSPKLTRALVEQALERVTEPNADLSSLSERERDVLRLIGRGESNADIAHALDLALPTVKSHVRHILAKLGVSRMQAMLAARSAGLCD
jgi:DNA-binding NarL/FixJ family response regulator